MKDTDFEILVSSGDIWSTVYLGDLKSWTDLRIWRGYPSVDLEYWIRLSELEKQNNVCNTRKAHEWMKEWTVTIIDYHALDTFDSAMTSIQ